MGLVPKGRFLVAGKAACLDGVPIPDLANRMHELPEKSSVIEVVGPDAGPVTDWLRDHGRLATIADHQWTASEPPERPPFRLWEPHSWVAELAAGSQPSDTRRALDLGCGSGRNAVCLASHGWNVTAIDHLPEAIEKTKDLESRYSDGPPIDWKVGDALEADGRFDAVISIRFFLPSSLERLHDWLAPGGWALFESFTESHRRRTGQPADASWVLRPDQLDGLAHFEIERVEEDERFWRVLLRR